MKERHELILWFITSLSIGFMGALFIETTPDSSRYLDQAHNWATGHGLVNLIDIGAGYLPFRTYVWPPLYSLLLGVLIKLGFPGLIAAISICAAGFAATTTIVLRFLQLANAAPVVRTGFLSLWIVWAQQQSTWHYAWSETLFLPLMALVMILTFHACRRDGDFWLSVKIGVVCTLCAMTRHIGIFTICSVVVSYVLVHVAAPERRSLRSLAVKLTGAGLGFAGSFGPYWAVMSSTRDEALSQFVGSTQWPFLKFVGFAVRAFTQDFAMWIVLGVVACAVALTDGKMKAVLSSCFHTAMPIVVWPAFYLAFLLLSAWTVGLVGADASRYSMPLYFSVVLLLAFLTGQVWKAGMTYSLRVNAYGTIVLATLLIGAVRVPEGVYRYLNSERTVRTLQRMLDSSTGPVVVATLFHRLHIDREYFMFPFPAVKTEGIPATSTNLMAMRSVLERSGIAASYYFYVKTPDDDPSDWGFDVSTSDIVGSVDGYVVYRAPLETTR